MKNIHSNAKNLEFATLDKHTVGEKAYTLALLSQKKFPVPQFRVIHNNHFENFLVQNKLVPKVEELLRQCNYEAPQSVIQTQRKIQEILTGLPLSAEVLDAVKTICTSLSGALMVRSSALGEDSAEASFAGQLDSFRTNGSFEEVVEAVRQCWASYWSARSLAYQHAKGKILRGMGVIVQELVEPIFAGVVFTQSPTGIENEMLIEYCRGHGENLVSGKVVPGEIRVNKDTQSIRIQNYIHGSQADNSTAAITGKCPFIHELIKYCIDLETLFKKSLDIEWAVDHEKNLFLLQSRPITAQRQPRKIFWSNVNVNENYPGPISPFLYSLALKSYYFYFKNLAESLGVPKKVIVNAEFQFNGIIGAYGARMYYNMTNIHEIIGLLPLGSVFSSFFNDFVGVDENKTSSDNSRELNVCTLADKLNFAGNTLFSLLLAPVKVKRFEKSADNHLHRFYKNGNLIKQQNLQSLTKRFKEFLEIRFLKWNDAAIADLSAMLSYGILGTFLKKIYPDEQARAKQNLLLQGIPNLVSSIPSQKIWELTQLIKKDKSLSVIFSSHISPGEIITSISENSECREFREALDQFLYKWGYRCSGELMLTEPNFLEQPESLIELLQGYLANDNKSPKKIIFDKVIEKKHLLGTIRKDLFNTTLGYLTGPLKNLILRILVHWTEKSISYRERVRLKQALLYGHFRGTLLNLGVVLSEKGIITCPNDIFFFKYHELLDLLSGSEMLPDSMKEIVQIRIDKHKENSTMVLPDHFYLAEGAFASENIAAEPSPPRNSNNIYKGISACGGIVKGQAKILNSVLEAKKIQPGDILVTKQTDPGWAPVFPLISGLVVERGGMLSHGVIVAREFGIPAVVGIKDITSIIKDGTEILVNGENGSIQF